MARVLVVDDEPDIAMSLAADLRRQGHEPESSPTASRRWPRPQLPDGT